MNATGSQPSSRPPFPVYPAVMCAIAFAILLIWRVSLPIGHNSRTAALEEDVRNIPVYRTEAYLRDALSRAEDLRDRIVEEHRRFTATRDRLNLWLALSGIATLALAVPAFASLFRRDPHHPAASPNLEE